MPDNNKVEYEISLKDLFSRMIGNAEKNTQSFERTLSSVRNSIVGLTAGYGFGFLAKEVFNAGTNMESLNVSMKTMLGSKKEADALIGQMVKFAQTTPFSQTEVQTAGKQLLAYGFAAKDIIPTLRKLGDVSAGISQPVGEIAYLYGTIKTQGKAMTVDIRQFANRGIPIYEELAKVTGKTGAALQKYIEDGKVGFPQIQKAFENMTGAGGKFNNLTEELAKTTGGQWSNTKDMLTQSANSIFKIFQPAINAFIKSFQRLIEMFQGFIKFVKDNREIFKAIAFGVGLAAAAFVVWRIATYDLIGAMSKLMVTLMANPVWLMVAGIAALGAAFYLAYQNSESFKEGVDMVIDSVKYLFGMDITGSNLEQSFGEKSMLGRMLQFTKDRVDNIIYAITFMREGFLHMNESLADIKIRADSKFEQAFGEGREAKRRMTALGLTTKILSPVASVLGAKGNSLSGNDSFDAGTSKVSGTKATTINITIGNIIEKFTISTTNLEESASKIKEAVTKALLEAVNDSQIIAGT